MPIPGESSRGAPTDRRLEHTIEGRVSGAGRQGSEPHSLGIPFRCEGGSSEAFRSAVLSASQRRFFGSCRSIYLLRHGISEPADQEVAARRCAAAPAGHEPFLTWSDDALCHASRGEAAPTTNRPHGIHRQYRRASAQGIASRSADNAAGCLRVDIGIRTDRCAAYLAPMAERWLHGPAHRGRTAPPRTRTGLRGRESVRCRSSRAHHAAVLGGPGATAASCAPRARGGGPSRAHPAARSNRLYIM